MFKILAFLLLIGAAFAAPGLHSNKIASDLQSRLANGGTANVFVSFVGGNKAALEQVNSLQFVDRAQRLNTLHDTLVEHADCSQRGVLSTLSGRTEVQSFWISNKIFLRGADTAIVEAIAEDANVSSIDKEVIAHIGEPLDMKIVTLAEDHQWGVLKIQAPQAWNELANRSGDAVVVATVDTGVRVTHEALRDIFLGDYGWFDPSTNEPLPTDRNGHGTHTTGTIAGGKGIGVAPRAKWAACRGCATSSCFQSDLVACAQFFACPTLADGTGRDCSKATHLVSNSWGGGRGNTWYNGEIDAWHAAQIIPIFSIGNSGPNCNTANSPGDQHVIGVGSTTSVDEISSFSSVGPTSTGGMKPGISAPGSAVVSAYNTGDTVYVALSGTSMACPHAAGTVALLMVRHSDLSYDQAKEFLQGTTDKDLKFSGGNCGGIGDDQFPNHIFGHGRINALKSVRAQTLTM